MTVRSSMRWLIPVLCTLALSAASGHGSAAAGSGLVAAYGFNEGAGTTVADTSGSSNTGTVANTTWSTQGKFGGALSFNGTNARVNVPNSSSLATLLDAHARGLGQPLGNHQCLARRPLQGERQLLPDGHDPAWRRRPGRRRHLRRGQPQRVRLDSTPAELVVASRNDVRRNHAAHVRERQPGRRARRHQARRVPRRIRSRSVATASTASTSKGLIDEVRVYNTALSQTDIQTDMTTPVGGTPAGRHDCAVGAGDVDGGRGGERADQSQLGRGDRQRRRHRLPGRALQRQRLHDLHADRRPRRHQLPGHAASPPPPATATASAPPTRAGNLGGYSNTAHRHHRRSLGQRPRRRLLLRRRHRHDRRRRLRQRQHRHNRQHRLVDTGQIRRRAHLQRRQRPHQHPQLQLPATHHRHDPRSLGQPSHHLRRLARRHLQGQRQLLPDGHHRPHRRRPRRRRQLRRSQQQRQRLRHQPAATQHLVVPRRHLRRRRPPLLRQRHPRRHPNPNRSNHHLHQPTADRQRQHLGPVLQRPHRPNPHLQHPTHRRRTPNRHDHPNRPPRPQRHHPAKHTHRPHDQRRRPNIDHPRLERLHRQRRRHRLPPLPRRHPSRHHRHHPHHLHLHRPHLRHHLHPRRRRHRRRNQHLHHRHHQPTNTACTDTTPPSTPTGLTTSAVGQTRSRSPGTPPPTTSPSPATASTKAPPKSRPPAPPPPPTPTPASPAAPPTPSASPPPTQPANTSTTATTSQQTTACTDTTPPSTPTGLTTSAVSQTTITLAWTASTDNVAVTGYRLYQGANQVATTGTTPTTYTYTGLTCGTTYTLGVAATDAATNTSTTATTSQQTSSLHRHHPAKHTHRLTTSAVGQTTITLSWTASTDNVGVTGYRVERCQGSGLHELHADRRPRRHQLQDTGLTATTSYSYRVRATDAAGNLGGYSNTATATTNAASSGGRAGRRLLLRRGHRHDRRRPLRQRQHRAPSRTRPGRPQGKYGGALIFNGINARVNIPDASSLQLTSGMTLEAWVNPATSLRAAGAT